MFPEQNATRGAINTGRTRLRAYIQHKAIASKSYGYREPRNCPNEFFISAAAIPAKWHTGHRLG